jgi:hypothetical protein
VRLSGIGFQIVPQEALGTWFHPVPSPRTSFWYISPGLAVILFRLS